MGGGGGGGGEDARRLALFFLLKPTTKEETVGIHNSTLHLIFKFAPFSWCETLGRSVVMLVDAREIDGVVLSLEEQLRKSEAQRDLLNDRYRSDRRTQEETQKLLSRCELNMRDLKNALRELKDEREKLRAAKDVYENARMTKPGTRLGKFTVPNWITPPSEKVALVAEKDGEVAHRVELARDCYILGRQAELCHIVLEHTSVSRQHAALVHGNFGERLGWYLVDLGSAHGTFLVSSPQKLQKDVPTPLLSNKFKIGKSTRVYSLR